MPAYYNEIDPYAAQWLRNLMAAGLIAPGVVDERSIEDVKPDELMGFTQHHFFAGIGGWSLALRLAGWPDDRPVWTGSCPCQPFSSAGKGKGFTDERHLWPAWFYLIEQHRPDTVFGEQVASKDGLAWLDLVYSDLEGAGYAVAPFDICAAGIGAPHIRQRLWFVADASGSGSGAGLRGGGQAERGGYVLTNNSRSDIISRNPATGVLGGLDNTSRYRRNEIGHRDNEKYDREQPHTARENGGMADANAVDSGKGGELGSTEGTRLQSGAVADGCGVFGTERRGPTNGLWRAVDWLLCRDGKWRPVEPGTFPLAHGIPNRVGRLRAYGNAINPYLAAEFIDAYMKIVF